MKNKMLTKQELEKLQVIFKEINEFRDLHLKTHLIKGSEKSYTPVDPDFRKGSYRTNFYNELSFNV